MPDDFAYINARLRGARGRFIGAEGIRGLLAADSLETVVASLRGSAYGPDLESALLREEGLPGVEEGLRQFAARALCRLPVIAEGRAGELVGVVLGRWENRCVKALLRGKARNASAAEILGGCVPAGRMDAAALRELAARGSVGEVLDLLVLWGFAPARAMRRAGGGRGRQSLDDIQRMEHRLDQAYLAGSFELLGTGGGEEGLHSFLRLEADVSNLLNLLRLTQARASVLVTESFFLAGGRLLSREGYLRLAELPDAARVIEALGGESILGRTFGPSLPAYAAGGRLSVFGREAHRLLLREALRLARLDPLGPGFVSGFVWSLVNEIMNLRLVCRARHAGLPLKDLSGELTLSVN